MYACVCSMRFISFVPLLLCFNFCFLSCALSVDVSSFATTVIGAMLAKTLQSHKYALIVVMLERTYYSGAHAENRNSTVVSGMPCFSSGANV